MAAHSRGAVGAALLGAALILVAGLFDAEPLYVPGIALLVLPAVAVGVGRGRPRAARRSRARSPARRVQEDEPLLVEIDVARRGASPCPPARSATRCSPRPARAGRRRAGARACGSAARFARRGRRTLPPPSVARHATRSGSPERVVRARGPADEVLVLPRVEPVLAPAGRRAARAAARPAALRRERRRGRSRRPARAPPGRARLAHRLAGLRAQPASCTSAACAPTATRARSSCSTCAAPRSTRTLDAAVRAAASLVVHLAERGGCALLLPGERRADRDRPRPARLAGGARPAGARRRSARGPSLAALTGRTGPVDLGRRRGRAARAAARAGPRLGQRPRPRRARARVAGRRAAVHGRRLHRLRARRAAPHARARTRGERGGDGGRDGRRRRPRRPARARPLAAPAVIGLLPRLVAFLGLAMLGLLHVVGHARARPARAGGRSPRSPRPLCAAALGGRGLARRAPAAQRGARRRSRWRLLAVALLGAEIPLRLLAPGNWGELVRSVARRASSALPGTLVPYGGADVLVRRTLLLGGTALTAIAVLQGFWPREAGRPPGSPAAAMVTLGTLYAVPVISRLAGPPVPLGRDLHAAARARSCSPTGCAARGSLPAVAARRRRRRSRAAAAAPALDRPGAVGRTTRRSPRTSPATGTVGYRWDHGYGPIDWPRDGRELLRIKAQAQSYWKAEVLDTFDGRAGGGPGSVAALEPDGDQDRTQPQWFQTITVQVRGLRSAQFVTAGSASRVYDAPRQPINAGAGTFVTQRGILRRGAEYKASVYTPPPDRRASSRTRRTAGPTSLARQWLRVDLPEPGTPRHGRRATARRGRRRASRRSARGEATLISRPTVLARRRPTAPRSCASTALRRASTTSRSACGRARTPAYDYVRRVRERVQRGAHYTRAPGGARRTRSTRSCSTTASGYCQHFSGAMALLLRMGGVPARVAVGFTPGHAGPQRRASTSSATSTRTPGSRRTSRATAGSRSTRRPAASPAREQVADQQAALTRSARREPRRRPPERPALRRAGGAAARRRRRAAARCLDRGRDRGRTARSRRCSRRRSLRPAAPALGAASRTTRSSPSSSARCAAPAARCRRTRRSAALERAARGHARRARTTCGRSRPAATASAARRRRAAQRAALREELAAGLGRAGRLRAWWALPPRPR